MGEKEICLHGIDQEKPLVIREGKTPDIFVYQGYRYELEDTESLIAFATKYSSKENGVILHDENGIGCLIDATVEDRTQDYISYCFDPSFAAEEWGGILKGEELRFGIRDMVKFLEHRPVGEIEVRVLEDLINSVKHMKYAITNEIDQSYNDTNNFTVAIKVGEHPGNVKIPRKVYVTMELIKNSGYEQEIEVEIETILMKAPTENGTQFALACPNWKRYCLNRRLTGQQPPLLYWKRPISQNPRLL